MSEETEVKKDKLWVKIKVQEELESWEGVEGGLDEEAIKYILNIIDQLDEPEVLSQELPVIPKFMADFIEVRKGKNLYNLLYILYEVGQLKKEYDWISANDEAFARAWLDGYTVEEEPLYYALIKGHELVNDEGEWSTKYWNLWVSGGCVFPADRLADYADFLTTMSKEEWSEWGINDTNADFVKVKDMENHEKAI